MKDLARSASASREELRARRLEIARMTHALAELERELAEARIALSRFEHRYYQSVGRRYVELDRLEARIAQARLSRSPHDADLGWQVHRTRRRAERSQADFHRWTQAPDPPGKETHPSATVKKLFREIASRIHPDLAEDESTRPLRTELMAELNAAYARGDTEGMRRILKNWEESPEAVPGRGPEADLARLDRVTARLRRKMEQLQAQLRRLKSSEMYRMMKQVRDAEIQGRDLLKELAEELARKIERAHRELAEIRKEETPDDS